MKFVILVFVACAAAIERNRIYMRQAELQDQENAASGYIYSADSSAPTSYVQYNSASGDLDHFGYPLITLGQSTPDIEAIHAPVQYVSGHGYDHPQAGSYQAYNDKGYYNEDFVKEDGKKYDEAEHSGKGEKSETGYKTVQKFDKGSKGSYSNEDDQGYYDDDGGHKDGHYDMAEHHNSNDEAYKGDKGGSFKESKGHKKGSKTTGFHKVYHKDEYKKDNSFYDEANKKGHFDRFGDFLAHHSSEEGGQAKGGKSESAYEDDKHGKKGHYDKGHYVDENSGHKGKEGEEKYYKEKSDYANKEGKESGKSYGYSEGNDGKY